MHERALQPRRIAAQNQVIGWRAIFAYPFYILCPDNDVPRQLDERRMVGTALCAFAHPADSARQPEWP